jgi:hypothetical protein
MLTKTFNSTLILCYTYQPVMASITDLSQELIFEIANYLRGDNQTLTSLGLVSRQFRGFAEEVSYTAITIQFTRPDSEKQFISNLVQTLIRRRDLAARTTVLTIRVARRQLKLRNHVLLEVEDDFTSTERYPTQEQNQLDEYLKSLEIALSNGSESNRSATEDFMSNWQRNILKGDQRTLVGVLLTLLPKLDTIHLSHAYSASLHEGNYPVHYFYGVNKFDRTPSELLSVLSNLRRNIKRLTVDHGVSRLLALGLENLKSLEITALDYDEDISIPSYSHLQELIVSDEYHVVYLDNKLAFFFEHLGCYSLTSLTYNCVFEEHHYVVDFNKLLNILAPLEETLEQLVVDVRNKRAKEIAEIKKKTIVPITSLKSLHKLRNLHIFQHALFAQRYSHPSFKPTPPAAVLPSSLTTLTIIWPTGKVFLWLENLYDDLAEFPNLKKIQLDCRPDFGKPARWFEAENHAVIDELRQAGIKVSFLDHGNPVIHKEEETDWWLHEDWFSIFDQALSVTGNLRV